MFLNQTTHYALRAVTVLVMAKNRQRVTVHELSEQIEVPAHYLSKIMRKLVEAGYVKAQKGHGGGYHLAVKPENLYLIDVLTAAGFDIDEQPCVFGWEKCSNEKPCPLHPIWKQLKEAFRKWACETTFEDVQREGGEISFTNPYREAPSS